MAKIQATPQKRKVPWDDDPRLGHYIDDGALFVLDAISKGRFAGKSASYYFFIAFCQPLDWDHKTLVKFLVKVAEEYDLELKNFETMTYAFAEEYEEPIFDEKTGKPFAGFEKVWATYNEQNKKYEECRKEHNLKPDDLIFNDCRFPIPPKRYGGAYKWALDEVKKRPQTSEGKLLSRIFDGKFDLSDLKEALKISDWPLPVNGPKDTKEFFAKKICEDISNWASFEVVPGKQATKILRKDLDEYLEKFIRNNLQAGLRERRIGNTLVLRNPNFYTFSKHTEMFLAKFRDMQENYGDVFVFENPFEKIAFDPFDKDKENMLERYAARQLLFMHTMFAFEKLGYIKILTLGNNWHWSEEVEDLRDTAKIQLLPPILKELGTETESGNLSFDEDRSRLFIKNAEVKVRKFSDQYHTLRIIFTNPTEIGQEWFFSEIAERIDSSNINDKRYYNAIYQIGLKAKTEGFPDFFITTRQSAKINPKYLS